MLHENNPATAGLFYATKKIPRGSFLNSILAGDEGYKQCAVVAKATGH